MVDTTVEYTDIRDSQEMQRDGSSKTYKRVTFYLGKFGPFVERFDVDGFSMTDVQTRVDTLRTAILGLHQA
jgi:hypothetical protein